MPRRIIIMVAALALLVVSGGSVAIASSGNGGRSLTVVERATTDTVIDLGAPGDSIGDQLTFGNNVYDKTDARQVGRDEGDCFRTNPGVAWECTWTTLLAGGSLTVQGPFYDDGHDSLLAITGGTGTYRNARGQMTLHARNKAGTEYDFIFSAIGG